MNIKDAILLGIVEGITEFLPVSSTGHMILVAHLIGLEHGEFLKSFEIAVQLGAICSVFLLYWRALLLSKRTFIQVFSAFLPTAILGLLLYSFVKNYLIGNQWVVILTLTVGGLFLIGADFFLNKGKRDWKDLSFRECILIGLFQSLALIPGVSRSGASVMGGLAVGLSREKALEFSFLVGLPTVGSASLFEIYKSYETFQGQEVDLLTIGFISAFVSALLTMRFALYLVRKVGLWPFGVYRIVLALIFLVGMKGGGYA